MRDPDTEEVSPEIARAMVRTRALPAVVVVVSNPDTPRDPQREAYLRKPCTCGAGFADACCATCWPV